MIARIGAIVPQAQITNKHTHQHITNSAAGPLHLQLPALVFHGSAAEDALTTPCERSPTSHWETELTVYGSTLIVCMAAIVKVYDTELIK